MFIFCCGMMRSGSTVQYNLTTELIQSVGKGDTIGWAERDDFLKIANKYIKTQKYHIVNLHNYFEEAAELIKNGDALAIYVFRDIRDVVVSIMNMSGSKFRHIVGNNFIERQLNNYYRWAGTSRIYVSKYEEIVKDLGAETFNIAKFLGLNISRTLAKEIGNKYELQKQKKRMATFDYNKYGKQSGKGFYDPKTQLHNNHIHSGASGQWQSTLSPLKIGFIEDIAHNWLIDNGYAVSQNILNRKLSHTIYSFYPILSKIKRLSRKTF